MLSLKSLRSGNLASAQATGANSNGLGCTVNNCLYLANIGLPRSVGLTMRVRNGLSENDALSADAALCHIDTSLCVQAERNSFDRAFLVDFHRTFAIIPYSKQKSKSFLKKIFNETIFLQKSQKTSDFFAVAEIAVGRTQSYLENLAVQRTLRGDRDL